MMDALSKLKKVARPWVEYSSLPREARLVRREDHGKRFKPDMGSRSVIEAGVAWLFWAQDQSNSHDGGVARHYSLIDGWSASYPETSGYIIPTLLDYGRRYENQEATERGLKIAKWLASIQFPEGGFQGGMIGQTPRVPVTFNTGQILIGLAAAAAVDARFSRPMRMAADWLVVTQDADGCWRSHPTPFAAPGEKTYETHVSLGLFEAWKLSGERRYLEAGLRQVEWALSNQRANGWLANCCLDDPERPLTHTLGYALRGIISAYVASQNALYLERARLTADALMQCLESNGRLAGRFDSDWNMAVDWACLTGASQIAECWLLLHAVTGDGAYRDAAWRANSFVRRTISLDATPDIRGGVKGSHPVDGGYGRWQLLNWACKFTIDANQAELDSGSDS